MTTLVALLLVTAISTSDGLSNDEQKLTANNMKNQQALWFPYWAIVLSNQGHVFLHRDIVGKLEKRPFDACTCRVIKLRTHLVMLVYKNEFGHFVRYRPTSLTAKELFGQGHIPVSKIHMINEIGK